MDEIRKQLNSQKLQNLARLDIIGLKSELILMQKFHFINEF